MFTIYADGQLIYQPGNDSLSLITPKLTVEMGKAGSLEFSMPPTSRYYNNLDQIRTKITVEEDGVEIFRGRVLSNKRGFNNVREVYCEGNLSYLVDSCQKGKKYKGNSHELFDKIIAAHNKMIVDEEKQFVKGIVTVEEHPVELRGQDDDIQDLETNKFDYRQIALNSTVKEWLNTYDYIETSLLDYCGGYLRTRYDAATGKTYLDWLDGYYEESTQVIQFGKNLLDLSEEISAEDLFTVLIPLGDENLTIKKVNNDSIELVDEEAVAKYGRIVQTHVFDGVTNPTTLLNNAKRYLKNHVEVPTTYEIKAVDLHLINSNTRPIYVGDKVQVLSPPHGIDESGIVCTKIEYDLTNPANTTYTFGNPKQDLTERYRKNRKDDAGRGGGGGGAAAEQASEEQTEIWDAWVTIDKEHAKIDIGALYKKLNPRLATEDIISKSQILLGSDENGTGIDLISLFKSRCDMIETEAGFTTRASADGSHAIMYVTDHKSGEKAYLDLGLSYHREQQEDGSFKTEVNTIAKLVADEINLSGRLLTIETEWAKIDSKVVEVIADKLKISAASGVISFGGNVHIGGNLDALTYLVAGEGANRSIADHYHKLSADSSGKVTLGTWTWNAANASFSIADTEFYQNMVSALTIKTVGVSFNRSEKKVNVKITSKSNENLWDKSYTNQLQPASIGIKITASGDHYVLVPRPYGPGDSGFIPPPNASEWDEIETDKSVYNSVTIKSVKIDKNYVAGNLYSVTATATASNGKSKSTTVNV